MFRARGMHGARGKTMGKTAANNLKKIDMIMLTYMSMCHAMCVLHDVLLFVEHVVEYAIPV